VESSVKCSKCGFENRADARFCKGCGQVLQASPASRTPSTPLGVVCLACGFTTAKAGARFCLRCGKPLPTAVPGGPSTQSPVPPKSPPSGPKRRRRSLGWVWMAGGASVLMCIAVLGIAAVFVIPMVVDKEEEEPDTAWVVVTDEPSPTGVMPTATVMPTGTPVPSPLPTSTSVSSPTLSPVPTGTPSPQPLSPPLPPLATVGLALSADALKVNDLLTVAVTITNAGEVSFQEVRCQLVGEWSPQLEVISTPVVVIPGKIEPGASETAIFVLRARQPGRVRVQVGVTMEAIGAAPPPLGWAVSDSLEVTVLE